MVLFIEQYKLVLTYESVDKIMKCHHSSTIQVQAIEQYFPVVLFIEQYKLVLTYESVDKIMKCHHSSTSY